MADPATCTRQSLPVTPPAEHDSFVKGLFPPHMPPHPLAQPVYGAINSANIQLQAAQSSSPQLQTPSQTRTQQLPVPPIPGPVPHLYDRAGNPIDPRYVAMASRISAYYQQRCQAVANYQQQRCQQWANMQRQKCQDMMQAATMVVAWYIRDRIQRRRRRQKHQFRRALTRKDAGARPTKGETVRHWVLDVPSDVVSAGEVGREKVPDPEEADFTMDKEPEPDKDTKLYRVADDLIKSQVNKIDVPLMGVLDFDESSSEDDSSSESEEEEFEYDQDDEEMDDLEAETTDYASQGERAGEPAGKRENMGSQEVQVSSGKNSRKRARSSLDS